MKHEFHFYRNALATAVLLGHAGLALAADYTITDLGTLGGSSSYAYGINSLGAVVGVSETSSGDRHAFLYSNSVMSDLGTLGGSTSEAYAINDYGQVVGQTTAADGSRQSFLYSGGVMSSLGLISAEYYRGATAINNNGQIVVNGRITPDGSDTCSGGGSCTVNVANSFEVVMINNNGQAAVNVHGGHAYLLNDGTLDEFLNGFDNLVTDLGTLGSSYSHAIAINDHGEIVGFSGSSSGGGAAHAFLFSGGMMSDLGRLSDVYSLAIGINNKGQVVGFSLDTNNISSGFLYSDGKQQKLNELLPDGSGWNIDAIDPYTFNSYGVNDAGQIVGAGHINGETHAFLMTPVPIPAALWLFGSGLLGLTGLARSRKK